MPVHLRRKAATNNGKRKQRVSDTGLTVCGGMHVCVRERAGTWRRPGQLQAVGNAPRFDTVSGGFPRKRPSVVAPPTSAGVPAAPSALPPPLDARAERRIACVHPRRWRPCRTGCPRHSGEGPGVEEPRASRCWQGGRSPLSGLAHKGWRNCVCVTRNTQALARPPA